MAGKRYTEEQDHSGPERGRGRCGRQGSCAAGSLCNVALYQETRLSQYPDVFIKEPQTLDGQDCRVLIDRFAGLGMP